MTLTPSCQTRNFYRMQCRDIEYGNNTVQKPEIYILKLFFKNVTELQVDHTEDDQD